MMCLFIALLITFYNTVALNDWLINPPESFPKVTLTQGKTNDLNTYILSNGLISRTFIVSPNFATIAYDSYLNGNGDSKSSILRTLSPEAIIGINGYTYNVGGCDFKNTSITNTKSPNTAYIIPTWLNSSNLVANTSNSFIYNNNITVTPISIAYNFTPGTRHSPKYINWPPLGIGIEIEFIPSANMINLPINAKNNLKIYVRYELYQGMPIISKSLRIESLNPLDTKNISITNITVETLKVNIPYSPGSNQDAINQCNQYASDKVLWPYMNMITYSGGLFLTTDQAHGTNIHWYNDINMNNIWGSYQPNVDIGYYPQNEQKYWSVRLDPNLPGTYNGILETFRVLEIVLNIQSKLGNFERFGLSKRRMVSFLSPSTTENPIYAATIDSTNQKDLENYIDQCAECGFELLIFSFGSGFNMEKVDNKTLQFYADIIEYGANKGIEIGGYDLIMEDRSYGNGEYAVIGSDGKKK
eukprot:106746_1